eukprot:m.188751 g.188751  ORF g.188751 m.188751 type:complete len:631 (-) comp17530_c0_seq1:51-1943(-)
MKIILCIFVVCLHSVASYSRVVVTGTDGPTFTTMPLWSDNMMLQASSPTARGAYAARDVRSPSPSPPPPAPAGNTQSNRKNVYGGSSGPVVWGWAPPAAHVSVTRCATGRLESTTAESTVESTVEPTVTTTSCAAGAPGAVTVTTVTNSEGKWTLTVPAEAPSATTYTLVAACTLGCSSLTSSNEHNRDVPTITATNVLYGDVILCSGQSNMALNLNPIYNSTTIIAQANHPEIRIFRTSAQSSQTPTDHLKIPSAWNTTTPQSIPMFSAVCYLTALNLQRLRAQDGSPQPYLGLIESAVGSTDVQSWMSAEAQETARLSCWALPGFTPPAHLPPSQGHNAEVNDSATQLYNGMINPYVPYNISAILWDQGEDNTHYCSTRQYNCLWASMMNDWRQRFNALEIPIVAVQLGGYVDHGNVSIIRFSQTDAHPKEWWSNHSLRIPVARSGVAATYDLLSPQPTQPQVPTLSPWIHCRNKSEVGRRVALALHGLQVGNPDTPAVLGPVVMSGQVVLNETNYPHVVLKLETDSALTLTGTQQCIVCCEQDEYQPNSTYSPFQVANHKGIWLPARASVVDTSTVIVTPYPQVPHDWIAAVRYQVVDVPQCAMYNAAGVPAFPFELPLPYQRDATL